MKVINCHNYDLWQSSLLQCLLGELQALWGSVEVCGSIAYASQEPWIFAGTIRENILFGNKYDPIWYERVLEACSLDQVCCVNWTCNLSLLGTIVNTSGV